MFRERAGARSVADRPLVVLVLGIHEYVPRVAGAAAAAAGEQAVHVGAWAPVGAHDRIVDPGNPLGQVSEARDTLLFG